MGEFVATKLVEDTGGFAHVTAAGNARWASFAEAAAAQTGPEFRKARKQTDCHGQVSGPYLEDHGT